jgi:hypothetical protein
MDPTKQLPIAPLRMGRISARKRKTFNTRARAPIQGYRNAFIAATDAGHTPDQAHEIAMRDIGPILAPPQIAPGSPPAPLPVPQAVIPQEPVSAPPASVPEAVSAASATVDEDAQDAAPAIVAEAAPQPEAPAPITAETKIPIRKLAPKTKGTL